MIENQLQHEIDNTLTLKKVLSTVFTAIPSPCLHNYYANISFEHCGIRMKINAGRQD
jgi:hypothetical protein